MSTFWITVVFWKALDLSNWRSMPRLSQWLPKAGYHAVTLARIGHLLIFSTIPCGIGVTDGSGINDDGDLAGPTKGQTHPCHLP
ncbi:MAG: hypothetical protein R2857_04970 [Vampirovibrionales bacterium]